MHIKSELGRETGLKDLRNAKNTLAPQERHNGGLALTHGNNTILSNKKGHCSLYVKEYGTNSKYNAQNIICIIF